jgi:exodeoxyribonuclease VII large subunit
MFESTLLTLTVSELNQSVKSLLENTYGMIAVTGEISNLSKPSSGHYYFTLKDTHAQVRCAFFKTYQRQLSCTLQEGMQVIATGKLSLFEPRGDYQLIVQHVEEAGIGALYRQFEALKKKLSQEGLFDTLHKRTLPRFPHTIALVTSPKGAALRDILITLYRRYPVANILVYPCEVQGQTAAAQLTCAIQTVCQENHAEVIILSRGGGSIEDLWAFNNEALARAIFHAHIPIVTGIGHETDFTIADFVADYRAATPTAAAAAISPDQKDLHQQLLQHETRLVYYLIQQVNSYKKQLAYLENQLKSYAPRLSQQSQTLDFLEQQLEQALNWLIHKKKAQLEPLYNLVLSNNLYPRLDRLSFQQEKLQGQLISYMEHELSDKRQALSLYAQTLDTLSPLDTLNRGYAIATQSGKILMDSGTVLPDQVIEIRLAKGKLHCKRIF